MSFGNERAFIDFLQSKERVRKMLECPSCEEELTRIGYTEHGTLELKDGEWLKSDKGEDADYYCLECNYHFTYEELEKLGVV